jgi:hypothetical protein
LNNPEDDTVTNDFYINGAQSSWEEFVSQAAKFKNLEIELNQGNINGLYNRFNSVYSNLTEHRYLEVVAQTQAQ